MKKTLLFLCCIFLLTSICLSNEEEQKYIPDPDPLVNEKLQQWQDLKFGLFMHWGTYSQWGIVESWSLCPEDYGWCQRKAGSNADNYFEYVKEYENLKTTFNPEKFDPEKWAAAAKNAGMKYVVFTTKHHDGFCMFDSKHTDYKITDKNCPFHKNKKANITKEIFDAFRAQGFWTGTYFSKPDWNCDYYWDPYFPPIDRNVNYDPLEYPEKWQKFVDFTHNQILELMSDYGKIDILWLDGGWVAKETPQSIREFMTPKLEETKSGFLKSKIVNQDILMDQLVEKVRRKQPGIIVVDRAVEGKNQNYLTPENKVPPKELPFPWESCIIAGQGWSWVPNAKYKSSYQLVNMLVDIVCKGGNLLLNIAPGPDGTFDEQAYQRLADIGDWMAVNSEAIYKTRAIHPYKEGKLSYTNTKDTDTVYAIFTPEESKSEMPAKIKIPSFTPADSSKVILLGFDKPLKWHAEEKGTIVHIPKTARKNPPCRYAWVIKFQKSE